MRSAREPSGKAAWVRIRHAEHLPACEAVASERIFIFDEIPLQQALLVSAFIFYYLILHD